MVKNAEQFDPPVGPPRIAFALISFSAGAADKAALIGDLEEEFGQRSRKSLRDARAWYWRQASRSLPYLLLERMRSDQMRRIGVALLSILAAFILITLWDSWVARSAARGLYGLSQSTPVGLVRAVYLIVQMIGIALAGGIIAALTFQREETFLRNSLVRLAPAGLILFAPWIIATLNPADTYPVGFRLIWLGMAAPSLVAGARGFIWSQTKR